jgi:hypothetical protein
MSKKEKPLPTPPGTPFGGKKRYKVDEGKEPLMANEMAQAMAEGRLEEYLQNELPDSEYARKLTEMMMGMTGMMPPEDVVNAAEKGDVKGLIELLKMNMKSALEKRKTIRAKVRENLNLSQ